VKISFFKTRSVPTEYNELYDEIYFDLESYVISHFPFRWRIDSERFRFIYLLFKLCLAENLLLDN